MLDAYIIDRIRRERENARSRDLERIPLHIEDRPMPQDPALPPVGDDAAERDPNEERGTAVIDFQL